MDDNQIRTDFSFLRSEGVRERRNAATKTCGRRLGSVSLTQRRRGLWLESVSLCKWRRGLCINSVDLPALRLMLRDTHTLLGL